MPLPLAGFLNSRLLDWKLFSNVFRTYCNIGQNNLLYRFLYQDYPPERIRDDMQEELMNYLRLKQVEEVDNLEE